MTEFSYLEPFVDPDEEKEEEEDTLFSFVRIDPITYKASVVQDAYNIDSFLGSELNQDKDVIGISSNLNETYLAIKVKVDDDGIIVKHLLFVTGEDEYKWNPKEWKMEPNSYFYYNIKNKNIVGFNVNLATTSKRRKKFEKFEKQKEINASMSEDDDEDKLKHEESMSKLRESLFGNNQQQPNIILNQSPNYLMEELVSPINSNIFREKKRRRSFDEFTMFKPSLCHLEEYDKDSTQFFRIGNYCIDAANPKSLRVEKVGIVINISNNPLFKQARYKEINVNNVRMYGAKFKKIVLCRKNGYLTCFW
jgi:hypothetical protein